MNKSVITQQEITEFLNNSNLQMLSEDDFNNAMNISNKAIVIKISAKEFYEKVIKNISNIKALFVIIEILNDESIQDVYKNIYDEIGSIVSDDIIMLFDTNTVASISDKTISLIVFY